MDFLVKAERKREREREREGEDKSRIVSFFSGIVPEPAWKVAERAVSVAFANFNSAIEVGKSGEGCPLLDRHLHAFMDERGKSGSWCNH